MAGKRPMTKREKEMLSEEYKSNPNYSRFRSSGGAADTLRNRGRQIDSIVDEAVRGGSERQSSYPRN